MAACIIVVTQKLVLQQSKNVTVKFTKTLLPPPCIRFDPCLSGSDANLHITDKKVHAKMSKDGHVRLFSYCSFFQSFHKKLILFDPKIIIFFPSISLVFSLNHFSAKSLVHQNCSFNKIVCSEKKDSFSNFVLKNCL